jgi:5-formyltetrahydrofolate cyclo-ligase
VRLLFKNGVRFGKVMVYADLEWGMFTDLGLVDETTPVMAVVHDVQLVEEQASAL